AHRRTAQERDADGRLTFEHELQQPVRERREALESPLTLGADGHMLEHLGARLAVGDPERELGGELARVVAGAVTAHRRPPAPRGARSCPFGSASWRCRRECPRARRSRALSGRSTPPARPPAAARPGPWPAPHADALARRSATARSARDRPRAEAARRAPPDRGAPPGGAG